jgi:hypothetical protein
VLGASLQKNPQRPKELTSGQQLTRSITMSLDSKPDAPNRRSVL